jgi:hypothetical protein
LITALGQLTVGVLEGTTNAGKRKANVTEQTSTMTGGIKAASSKHVPNETEVLASVNTFAISRLVETALVNISRVEMIWKVLVRSYFFIY